VQNRGAIWYVDMTGHRHQVTVTNIIDVFRRLALGITLDNLDKIPAGE
jgi:hypothetical protein